MALPILDVLAVAAAIYLAFALRFDDLAPIAVIAAAVPVALLPLAVRPAINRIFGLYRHSWRFVSVPELLQLCLAIVLGTLLMLAVFVPLWLVNSPLVAGFPRSFWLIEAGLSLALMGLVRLVPRILLDYTAVHASDRRLPAILYGAGAAGAMMARGASRQPSAGVRPVAFLDDDPSKWGKVHAGVKVLGGLDAMSAIVGSTGAELLLITMPTASGETVRRVADEAIGLGLQVRTVPSLDEMLHGSFHPEAIRPLKMEDLLRRPPVEPTVLNELAADLRSETALVTGAGGSIGSELARQLVALSPRKVVLLDRAEGPLYELQLEIEAKGLALHTSVEYRIGDISNASAMQRLMESAQPSVIFHAAAYKHVPMMEQNPAGAVEVNVGGTLTLLEAAERSSVRRFVLVSTDKAVDPTSVMGATKRMAELLVAEFSAKTGRPWVSVRFGNVLGSSGSVVPIFQKQLERGEPLTVTHKDMTRYFMTIPEAVHLILQAATMARPGDLFVLDMGEPVRILDLATDILRLQGRDTARTPIRITAPRPGEKMHEQLYFGSETITHTDHPKVRRVISDNGRLALTSVARDLVTLAQAGADDELRTALRSAVGVIAKDSMTVDPTGTRAEDARTGPRAGPVRVSPYRDTARQKG